jgi:hypothetical protein
MLIVQHHLQQVVFRLKDYFHSFEVSRPKSNKSSSNHPVELL